MRKLLLVTMLCVVLSVSMVVAMESANVTIVTPSASGSLTGATALWNISFVTGFEAENWTSANVYLSSASLTANTTEVQLVTAQTNETDLNINGTIDTTGLEDANDYVIKFQIMNGTDEINITRTGITIQNTIPQTPTLSPASQTGITTSTTQTFTGAVTDANTTSCTYTIARGGATSGQDYISGTGTYSGSSCTFTKAFSSTLDNGVWDWTITASDETDTTSSTTNKIVVSLPGAGGGYVGGGTQDGSSQDGIGAGTIVLIIFGILALGGVVYFIVKN